MFRFYNGGNAENLTLAYSIEDRNGHHNVHIPAQGFFEVPETKVVGNVKYFTNFDATVPTRKGQFGVVRVDPTAEETPLTGRIARTDAEAKQLGDRIHQEYLIGLVQDYINRVNEFRAQGLHPLPAQGYTKYALKTLNIEDPAEPVRNFVNRAIETERIQELEARVASLDDSPRIKELEARLAKAEAELKKAAKAS